MKPSVVLTKAKKLIEKGWCRGVIAKNVNGKNYYSADGAIEKAGPPEKAEIYFRQAIERHSIVLWNDHQTSKRPVLRAFDRAIKLAKSEGK